MNFLLFSIINNVFNLLQLLIMIRVVLSWIDHDPYNQFIKLLYSITDTILEPIRDLIPLQASVIDFTPMVAFVLIGFIKNILLSFI
ncbi:MAG: YggT family protein [Candidatus Marinimicrobia bacterium]|jgi:YggT family protein|nr:YggT family protein [Candidatus Neomarinimicrobiota bacterium]MDA8752933.1 YggT family protein [Candidatus Neomarinimicrobiota bacterium]